MNADDWQAFGADVVRGAQVQHVGYSAWYGEGPNDPEATKLSESKPSSRCSDLTIRETIPTLAQDVKNA
jgi:hypothetical protein